MRWVLLLRAVNLGPTNKLPMKDLTAALEGLGCSDVRTHLNSGNATFASAARSPKKIASDVAEALRTTLGLDVRCCVRSDAELRAILDAVPDLPGYVTVSVLFDQPAPQKLADFLATDWSPEVVQGNERAIFIGFSNAGRTTLTNARLEKALGVSATARTPATLRRLVG